MKKSEFAITGMHCASCAAAVTRKVSKLDGVRECYVNIATHRMTVTADESKAGTEQILAAVRNAGYGGSELTPQKPEGDSESSGSETLRFFTALVFAALLAYAAMHRMLGLPYPDISPWWNAAVQILLLLPVLAAGYTFYLYGFRTLAKLSPNMDSLIALGTGAAVVYSVYLLACGRPEHLYFDTAGMIVALIMLGKYLEARSRGKASGAIRELMKLSPKTATAVRGGKEVEIPLSDLKPGEILRVKPGERIPADGIISQGLSTVDESMLTGEPMPVEKSPGSFVTGGSINRDGTFLFEAKHVGADTTLAKIIDMVRSAQGSRPPIARLADTVSGWFVWFVIAAAALTFGIWFFAAGATFARSLEFTLAVLVIACPCALGLATPIALIAGIGRGASLGILIRNGAAVETAAKTQVMFFDKTGTLTVGAPEVASVIFANGSAFTADSLLKQAASAEQHSEHPLAKALVSEAKKRNITLDEPEDFHIVPGRGMTCSLGGKKMLLGNARFMMENNISLGKIEIAQPGPVIFASADSRLEGAFVFADRIKESAPDAVKRIHELGIKAVMLTGDARTSAETVSRQLQLDGFRAGLLPADKASAVKEYQSQGFRTAMAGDGINDAPALAQAELGIAMGSGTDAAMESADIVLMRHDLRDAASAVELSRATMRIIRENLFWAFLYNIVCIPLAAGVFWPLFHWQLNPVFGALAMAFSSVTVVLNALRLRGFRPHLS